MKKTAWIIVTIIMTLSLCIGLVGCNKGEESPQPIELTSDNYGDYLAINVEFDTPEIVSVYSSTGTVIGYHLYCRGRTIIKKCANVQFENCSMSVRVTVTGWPSGVPTVSGTDIELSYDGEGTGTFSVYDYFEGEHTNLNLSVPILKTYSVTSVEGKIILNA